MTDVSANELKIKKTRLERDLGVIVSDDLKRSAYVDMIVGKANRILSMLKRTFEIRDPVLWNQTCSSSHKDSSQSGIQSVGKF